MLGNPTSPLLWHSSGKQPVPCSLPAWCAYTGQSEQAAANWGWLKALPPEERADVRAIWEEAFQARNLCMFTCQIRHVCQGYRSFKALNIPDFGADLQLEGWFTYLTEMPATSLPVNEDWEIKLLPSTVFSQTTLGIFCLSLDGAILRVNQQFCQFTGYSEAELLAMTLWQINLPPDRHIHLQAMHERLTTGESTPLFRTRYLRKDGTPTWARVAQFLVRQPTGEPCYFFFSVEDINAQVQAENEHTALLARFQEAHNVALERTHQLEAVFEAITDGILVSDSAGNIIHSNAAFKQLIGQEQCPKFLKLPMADRLSQLTAIDENGQVVAPEQWPLARILRGETLSEGHVEDFHLFLPDSKDMYVNYSGTCMRDQDGHITGCVLVIHNINERHLLENRVRQSFRILLTLAEELVDLPHYTTQKQQPDERHTHPLQTVGERLAELTCQMLEYRGVSLALLDPAPAGTRLVAVSGFSPEERAFYSEMFSSALPTELLKENTIALLSKNEVVIEEFLYRPGDPAPYKVLLAPMLQDGRLVGILCVEKARQHGTYTSEEFSLVKAIAKFILLVIERERLQREWLETRASELALRETKHRFDEFLSIASHELRTPLTGIKGNIQLALRRLASLQSKQLPDLEILYEKLQNIQDYLLQAEHRTNVQNRMISDLLDVSRIQANRLELVMGPCDLRQVICAAVKDQQYNVPGRVITLHARDDEPIMVIGDADRLAQVIHNYLTNALKYSPADRPVAVSLAKEEQQVRVAVQDQGPGLTPAEQQRVWERFYRARDVPALRGGRGLGLGLHICRTIIEAHQGTCGLTSAPGQGSTFWFTLRLATPRPELLGKLSKSLTSLAVFV